MPLSAPFGFLRAFSCLRRIAAVPALTAWNANALFICFQSHEVASTQFERDFGNSLISDGRRTSCRRLPSIARRNYITPRERARLRSRTCPSDRSRRGARDARAHVRRWPRARRLGSFSPKTSLKIADHQGRYAIGHGFSPFILERRHHQQTTRFR